MVRKKLDNMKMKQFFKLFLLILALGGCDRQSTIIESDQTKMAIKPEITDKYLTKCLDKYISKFDVNPKTNLLRIILLTEPYEKSVVVVNMPIEYLNSKFSTRLNCMYKEFHISIYSGLEQYDLFTTDMVQDTTKDDIARVYDYVSIQFKQNLLTKKDTFYIMESNPFLMLHNSTNQKLIFKKNEK